MDYWTGYFYGKHDALYKRAIRTSFLNKEWKRGYMAGYKNFQHKSTGKGELEQRQ